LEIVSVYIALLCNSGKEKRERERERGATAGQNTEGTVLSCDINGEFLRNNFPI